MKSFALGAGRAGPEAGKEEEAVNFGKICPYGKDLLAGRFHHLRSKEVGFLRDFIADDCKFNFLLPYLRRRRL